MTARKLGALECEEINRVTSTERQQDYVAEEWESKQEKQREANEDRYPRERTNKMGGVPYTGETAHREPRVVATELMMNDYSGGGITNTWFGDTDFFKPYMSPASPWATPRSPCVHACAGQDCHAC
jgi:hypothetical protein